MTSILLILAWMAPAGQDAKVDPATERAMKEVAADLGADFSVDHLDDRYVFACNAGAKILEDSKDVVSKVDAFLHKAFFASRPAQALKIYLFKDQKGYDDWLVKIHAGEEMNSSVGRYFDDRRTLALNIASGNGTLSHELTHALMAPDMAEAPIWFGEGLASLYEYPRIDKDGNVEGQTNWRLPLLQAAISKKRSVPLAKLLLKDGTSFHDAQVDLHYASARFLCQYLQEQRQLQPFYKEFKATFHRDPSGKLALEKVTGRKLADLNKLWIDWVAALKPK